MVFICSVCGEDIPMSRRQGYIVELADGSFYWFGGGKGMGFHTCSKFIYHLRKNQQKNYSKIHRIFKDGSTREVSPERYAVLETYITDFAKYLKHTKDIGFSRGLHKPSYKPTIQSV
jgi:hypothetical protein